MDESGRSSWELLQNCYCMKDCHEQKIPLVLALTQLFLNKIGGGICRVHGGGFAGVIAAVVPENEMENYVEYISCMLAERTFIQWISAQLELFTLDNDNILSYLN